MRYSTDWLTASILSVLQAQVHRATHGTREVQCCTLLSIKTGGCSEDCKYCAQSSRYETSVEPEKFMQEDAVLEAARRVRFLKGILDAIRCRRLFFVICIKNRRSLADEDMDLELTWKARISLCSTCIHFSGDMPFC